MSVPEDILESMSPREIIGQAVALLQSLHGVSEGAAFRMLVEGSSDSHEKVRETAGNLIRESGART